eukprot:10206253-Ditylum_brightwellii.AAC.1
MQSLSVRVESVYAMNDKIISRDGESLFECSDDVNASTEVHSPAFIHQMVEDEDYLLPKWVKHGNY